MRSTTAAAVALASTLAVSANAAAPVTAPPWLGVAMAEVGDKVVVRRVTRRSPADAAGIRAGDGLVRVGDKKLGGAVDVSGEIRRRKAGEQVDVAVSREGTLQKTTAKLETVPGDSELLRRDVVGQKAPSLRPLSQVQGDVPEEVAGKVTVVVFFASWCVACRAEAPTMNRWHDKFSALGVRVIGVGADGPYTASKVAEELELKFAVTADPANLVSEAWQSSAVPTVYVVDKKGVIRNAVVGLDPPELRRAEAQLEKLAAE